MARALAWLTAAAGGSPYLSEKNDDLKYYGLPCTVVAAIAPVLMLLRLIAGLDIDDLLRLWLLK